MRLAEAGFKLKKFVTNSDELGCKVNANERTAEKQNTAVSIEEEDQSYARGSLGTKSDEMEGRHKIFST